MNELQQQFNKWLNKELEIAGVVSSAFCINIYQEDEPNVYSFDLAGFAFYTFYNDDWASEDNEIYSSRNHGNLMVAEIAGGRPACLRQVRDLIDGYIRSQDCDKRFSDSKAAAFGFVDGELITAFYKD